MATKIRLGVFETNSSSVHSITLGKNKEKPRVSKVWEIWFGEYGWGPETLYSPGEKMGYVLTSLSYQVCPRDFDKKEESLKSFISSSQFQAILKMVKKELGVELKPVCPDDFYGFGYIDHQSEGLVGCWWNLPEKEYLKKIKQLVFTNSSIRIDNDNH